MTSISKPGLAMVEVLPHKIEAHLKQLRGTWIAGRRRRAVVRKTYEELTALSDRALKDIGIGRGDIRNIAQQAGEKEL